MKQTKTETRKHTHIKETNHANVTLILANPDPQRKIKAKACFLSGGFSLFAKPGFIKHSLGAAQEKQEEMKGRKI